MPRNMRKFTDFPVFPGEIEKLKSHPPGRLLVSGDYS